MHVFFGGVETLHEFCDHGLCAHSVRRRARGRRAEERWRPLRMCSPRSYIAALGSLFGWPLSPSPFKRLTPTGWRRRGPSTEPAWEVSAQLAPPLRAAHPASQFALPLAAITAFKHCSVLVTADPSCYAFPSLLRAVLTVQFLLFSHFGAFFFFFNLLACLVIEVSTFRCTSAP